MDKSFVTLEQNVCLVCGNVFDTDSLLLDQRMRERFERNTVTGWGLCEEHQQKFDEGYIALVGVNNTTHQEKLKPEDADRSGRIAHMKMDQWEQAFNVPLEKPIPAVFVEDQVITMLLEAQK